MLCLKRLSGASSSDTDVDRYVTVTSLGSISDERLETKLSIPEIASNTQVIFFLRVTLSGRRASGVCIVNKLHTIRLRNCGMIFGRKTKCSLLHNVSSDSRVHPTSSPLVTWDSFFKGKVGGAWRCHPRPSSTDVKDCGAIPSLPIYVFKAWYLNLQLDNVAEYVQNMNNIDPGFTPANLINFCTTFSYSTVLDVPRTWVMSVQ
jgi:hypothetical protein